MFQSKCIQLGLAAFIFTSLLISGSAAFSDMPDQSADGTSQDYQTMSLGKSINFNAFIDKQAASLTVTSRLQRFWT
jgi:hypothetical protein